MPEYSPKRFEAIVFRNTFSGGQRPSVVRQKFLNIVNIIFGLAGFAVLACRGGGMLVAPVGIVDR
jgi:hypothetical protein